MTSNDNGITSRLHRHDTLQEDLKITAVALNLPAIATVTAISNVACAMLAHAVWLMFIPSIAEGPAYMVYVLQNDRANAAAAKSTIMVAK